MGFNRQSLKIFLFFLQFNSISEKQRRSVFGGVTVSGMSLLCMEMWGLLMLPQYLSVAFNSSGFVLANCAVAPFRKHCAASCSGKWHLPDPSGFPKPGITARDTGSLLGM